MNTTTLRAITRILATRNKHTMNKGTAKNIHSQNTASRPGEPKSALVSQLGEFREPEVCLFLCGFRVDSSYAISAICNNRWSFYWEEWAVSKVIRKTSAKMHGQMQNSWLAQFPISAYDLADGRRFQSLSRWRAQSRVRPVKGNASLMCCDCLKRRLLR